MNRNLHSVPAPVLVIPASVLLVGALYCWKFADQTAPPPLAEDVHRSQSAKVERVNRRPVNPKGTNTGDTSSLEHDNYVRYLKECDIETLLNELKDFSKDGKPANIETLLSIINNRIADEDFPKYWILLESIEERRDIVSLFQGLAIKRYAENGNIESAFSLIFESGGKGLGRNVLLKQLFSVAGGDPQVKIRLFSMLQSADERSYASRGLSESLAKSGTFDNIGMFLNSGNSSLIESAVNGLGLFVTCNPQSGQPVDFKERLASVLGILRGLDEGNRKSAVSKLISNIGSVSPDDVLNVLRSNYGPNVDLETVIDASAIQILAKSLTRISPKNTVADFSKGTSKTGFSAAFTEWLKLDRDKAMEWIQQNKDDISGEIGGQAYAILSQTALNNGGFEESRKWLESIKDPALRKQVEGQVWTAERDFVRKEIEKDPVGTMQSIIGGESKHSDYWLEEAMGTWVAKDFDKAQAWYQQNWNSLPANKSQYIAAAFANQAASQGDTATARQWAAYIQDAKTKQRIDDGISKAESQAPN